MFTDVTIYRHFLVAGIPITVTLLFLKKAMTSYSEEHVKNKLQRELEAVHVIVEDFSDGCGSKFNVLVVSPQFLGKSLLERQRMVNSVLEEEMKGIHALTQKTYTPEQWEKINKKSD